MLNQSINQSTDHFAPVSDAAVRHHQSAARHQLTVPPAFVAAPSALVSLLLLVLQFGIHCLSICVVQLQGRT